MIRLLYILFLSITPFLVLSQMQIDWQQCYCGMESDLAMDVAQSGDEFLVLGRIRAAPPGGQVTCTNEDATWLLKIDNMGNTIWQKCIFNFGGYKMQQAIGSDFHFITGATISDPYPDVLNLYLGKMDSTGSFIWERTLGNEMGIDDYHFYGASSDDGGILGSALIFSQGGDITNWYGGYDGWVIKLDSTGNTVWDFTLGSQNSDAVTGVEQSLDNGYIITGYGRPDGISGNITTPSYTSSASDAVIFKLDSLANVEWDKTYGGSHSDFAARAVSLNDGYLIAGGATSDDGYCYGSGWHEGYYHTGDRTADIWLIRTDLEGEIIWQKCYGGSQSEGISRVFSTSDGGFIVFGSTHSFDGDVVGNPSNSSAKSSIWIFKVNSIGDLIWQQCIGGFANEDVNGVIQHSDYNYTLAGEMTFSPSTDVNCSNFIPASGYNYWVLGISDTTVNITETQQLNDNISVYPNPANSILNIDFSNDYNIRNTTIEIVDINGKTILKLTLVNVSTQLDIKKINSGLYLVKIQNDMNLITKRIIIQ